MNEEMMSRVIHYLEAIQIYTKVMRTYYSRNEMDDFDKSYVDFYSDFEDLIYSHLQDPDSPLQTLMKHYQEFIVEYEDSILYRCLEALRSGYHKQEIFDEGKKSVYLRYLMEIYDFDASSIFESWSNEEFEDFEKHVFKDFSIETLKKPTH